jgi:hypothetical protein
MRIGLGFSLKSPTIPNLWFGIGLDFSLKSPTIPNLWFGIEDRDESATSR